MLRILIAIALTACIKQAPAPQAPKAEPAKVEPLPAQSNGELKLMPSAPRNFVCESFAAVNPKAVCTPEESGAGEFHTHSARVAIDGMLVSCMKNDRTPSVVCTDLIVVQPTQQRSEDKPPASPKKKGK